MAADLRRGFQLDSLTPVVVQVTVDLGAIVLVGATLSFVGLAEGGRAEVGGPVSRGRVGVSTGWWQARTPPRPLILPWALELDLVGESMRDVLDPGTEAR